MRNSPANAFQSGNVHQFPLTAQKVKFNLKKKTDIDYWNTRRDNSLRQIVQEQHLY